MREIKQIVTELIDNMNDEDIIKLSNSISDGDMSTSRAYHIYTMEQFNDYCEENYIYPLDLVEGLGSYYRFDTEDKYFMSYNGSSAASDLISFNSLFEVNGKMDFISFVTDEIENSTPLDIKDIVTNAVNNLIKEGDI